MCGRTACTLSPEFLRLACSYQKKDSGEYSKVEWIENTEKPYTPSYNVVPSSLVPVMISKKHLPNTSTSLSRYQELDEREHVIMPMMWGMVQPWDEGSPTKQKIFRNNCRIEGLLDPNGIEFFKDSLYSGKRCVALYDGFFAWKKNCFPDSEKKQPYFIYFPQLEGLEIYNPEKWKHRPIDEFWSKKEGWRGPKPLTLAGLFNDWESTEDGSVVYSYSLITMDSCPPFSWITGRMPAVLETEDDINQWLDFANLPPQEALFKLKPSTALAWHPVSTDVNSSRNHGDHLTKPIVFKKSQPIEKKPKATVVKKQRPKLFDEKKDEPPGSSKLMLSWLNNGSSGRAIQGEVDKKRKCSGLLREGVKRQLLTSDSTEAPSPKKVNEEANNSK